MTQKLLPLLFGLALMNPASAQVTSKPDGQWRAALGVAFSNARGNTEATNLSVQAEAVRETADYKWASSFNALRAETDGTTTADQTRAATRYDWNLTRRTFVFGGVDLERDDVALLDLRATLSTGAGYKIFDQPDLSWNVFGGLGVVSERYAAPRLVDGQLREHDDYPTALLGQESNHRFSETTTAKQRLTVLPNLDRSGEYRAQWDLGLAVAMTRALSVTLGLGARYNSEPGPGIKKTDTLFTAGVALKLE